MQALKQNSLLLTKILFVTYIILSTILYFSSGITEIAYIIGRMIAIVPHILLTIYVFVGAKKHQSNTFILVSYLALTLTTMLSLYVNWNILNQLSYLQYTDESTYFGYLMNLIITIVTLLYSVCCTISVISKFKSIIWAKISLVAYAGVLIYDMLSRANTMSIISIVSTLVLICGYILFWFFVVEIKEVKTNVVVNCAESLEDKIVTLKNMYDSGIITEEEYNIKKADILSKF